MDDRVEAGLEVDALGQAVGRDQQALFLLPQRLDPRLALLGRAHAGHNPDRVLLERAGQSRADRLGGGDVATEDDRRETRAEQIADGGAQQDKTWDRAMASRRVVSPGVV